MCFGDRVSFCIPVWPETHCVTQATPQHVDLLCNQVLRAQVCTMLVTWWLDCYSKGNNAPDFQTSSAIPLKICAR